MKYPAENYIPDAKLAPPGHLACAGMSVPEAMRFLGIGRNLLYNEINAGRLIARKAGARTIITTEDAVAYLRSLPQITAHAA